MPGDILMRAATAADGDGIAALIRGSKADAMPWLAIVHTPEEDRAWVAGVLLPEQAVVVATVDGALAAVLATTPGWIEQLYVATAHQGRGIGSALLDEAKRRHPDGLELWTFQRNARARSFYERSGFVAVQETDGDNEEREPDVRYRWTP